MVLYFRKLNEKIIADLYPLPNIHDILDESVSARYFSVFDFSHRISSYANEYQRLTENRFFHPFRLLLICPIAFWFEKRTSNIWHFSDLWI